MLERARKAETDSAAYKSQLKTESTSSKKALREMEITLAESTALSQRSEREYITLRESISDLIEGWKNDTDKLREEMRKREDRWKNEAEVMGRKYKKLVEEVQKERDGKLELDKLKEENESIGKEVEERFNGKMEEMRAEIERSSRETDEAKEIAL